MNKKIDEMLIGPNDACIVLQSCGVIITDESVRNAARRGQLPFSRARKKGGRKRFLFKLSDVLAYAEYRKAHPDYRGIRRPLMELLTKIKEQRDASAPHRD